MTFDELSTLKQPSASLRTALDRISAALGSVGDAGQQARSVVDELRVSLRAAAAQSVKSARSLAKFDEINRLSAPAEDKTAAPEKQKKAAEAAAKAEKAARSTTGTAARRSGTADSDLSGLTAVWQSVLESLRSAWADFWAYLQAFFAPFAAAWQTVWQGLSAAAAGVWEQLCAALSTVVQPALALLDTVWQGLWAGMEQAWAAYGQPILDGLAQGWQNVVGIVSALWSEVLQPVLVQLFDLLGALWTAHLQPALERADGVPRRGDNAAADAVEHRAGPVCAVAHHGAGPRGRAGVCGAGHGGDRCGGHHCGRHHDCAGGAARYGRLFDRRAAGRVGRCLGCDGRDGLYRVGAHRLHCADGGLHGAGRCAQHGRGHCRRPSTGCCRPSDMPKAWRAVCWAVRASWSAAKVRCPGWATRRRCRSRRWRRGRSSRRTGSFWRCSVTRQPARTWKRRWRPSSRPWRRRWPGWQGSADGQPINIYIGEELLDSVIANSQNRRALRSGGR